MHTDTHTHTDTQTHTHTPRRRQADTGTRRETGQTCARACTKPHARSEDKGEWSSWLGVTHRQTHRHTDRHTQTQQQHLMSWRCWLLITTLVERISPWLLDAADVKRESRGKTGGEGWKQARETTNQPINQSTNTDRQRDRDRERQRDRDRQTDSQPAKHTERHTAHSSGSHLPVACV